MNLAQRPDFRVKSVEEKARNRLNNSLQLTRVAIICERFVRLFWPVWSILFLGSAALMVGLQDHISLISLRIVITLATFSLFWFAIRGVRKFRFPTPSEVRDRLDLSVSDQPLAALADIQAIGAQDQSSRQVWLAHQARMRKAAQDVRAPVPDLKISNLDRFALRYAAVLVFVVALIFGNPWRVGDITSVAQGRPVAVATGPSWEGWIDPPAYTGLPVLYLNDQPRGELEMVEGSTVILRLYSDNNRLAVRQSISDDPLADTSAQPQSVPEHRLTAHRSGTLGIDGANGVEWQVTIQPDLAPTITVTDKPEVTLAGEMRLPFRATDDFGVTGGTARISLDLDAVDRIFGLRTSPDLRGDLTLDLPLTISGDRRDFDEVLIENLSQHPWAGLPVFMTLSVEDAAGHITATDPIPMTLPGRRFFDFAAKAVVEQRRDLLWARENARRIAQLLRTVTHKPADILNDASTFLMLRTAIRQLETATDAGLTTQEQDELADIFWTVATQIEDGDVGDALDRLRQAQERLRQAMRDGASDEEIAELMQDLREAVRDYMRQLAQNPESSTDEPNSGETQMLSQQDLQEMMDRIQELIEQGRFAEAEELMRQFQQMMENLRMTDQPGQGGQGEGQQAMEDLSETLRQQQGLSDEAFRQLQEQFNSSPQAGQSHNNTGRSGGEGRGQSHEGQGRGSNGQEGSGQSGERPGANPSDGDGQGESLADRQQALRDELRRQQQGLPGAGTPEGDAAREALDRAGRAMEGAEQALRDEDFAGALDNQAQALEALREGMRNLSEALAQGQNQPGSQQGEGQAAAGELDPLGRRQGADGAMGTEDGLLQGEDVYRRARDILDKLRERSSDQERPKKELEYLKRLLDRF